MSKKNEAAQEATTQLSTSASKEELAALTKAFPRDVEDRPRMSLPRLGMLAKDLIEENGSGKNKTITVLQAAGTFYTEKKSDETDEFGDVKWVKEFLNGDSIEVVVFYQRRQLKMFDSNTESFISSPIYDDKDQIVPLFQNGQEIAKGTPAELQSKYPSLSAKGKPTSKLKETRVLYVMFNGEPYQINLSESSKYAFKNYARRTNIPTVLTEVGSEEQTRGSNVYRQMTFKTLRTVTNEEFQNINKFVADVQSFLEAIKEQFTPHVEAKVEYPTEQIDPASIPF